MIIAIIIEIIKIANIKNKDEFLNREDIEQMSNLNKNITVKY